MIKTLVKLKMLKFTMLGAIASGIAVGTLSSIVAKKIYNRKKSDDPENKSNS